jgi:ribonuclease H / adenosylcobalamin/alpha-ribazole phosphatase
VPIKSTNDVETPIRRSTWLVRGRNVTRTILLARHGTHDEVGHVLSGRSEIGLNEEGYAQVAALVDMVQDTKLASLHSSPRRRTLETAAPVGARMALPIVTAAALDEIDFGSFTGRSFAELDGDQDWELWNSARVTARCPGGESMREAVDRASSYLFSREPDAYPLMAVTHCDIIRGLVAAVTSGDLGSLLSIDCDPGSITTLRACDGRVELLSLNVGPH